MTTYTTTMVYSEKDTTMEVKDVQDLEPNVVLIHVGKTSIWMTTEQAQRLSDYIVQTLQEIHLNSIQKEVK